MILNGNALLFAAPIKDMKPCKVSEHGVSYGLGEAGYDIRIKQTIRFREGYREGGRTVEIFGAPLADRQAIRNGRFALASAIEEFQMPNNLTGIVHDKSTWARRGLSVFNTVIEPGWFGWLTLELVYHGEGELVIPAGSGIAQVMFHQVVESRGYSGKYQNQSDKPTPAIESE